MKAPSVASTMPYAVVLDMICPFRYAYLHDEPQLSESTGLFLWLALAAPTRSRRQRLDGKRYRRFPAAQAE